MLETYSRIPVLLQPHEDDRLREAHAQLATMSLDEVQRTMPAVQRHGEDHAGFVDLRPEDHEPDNVVVVPFPFVSGWGASMALRLRLLQASMPEPTRVIGFPHNTMADRRMYSLTKQEVAVVGTGDFEPLARRQLNTLETLGVESFGLWGYSAGAAIGASTLRLAATRGQFALNSSGLAEEPNGLDRSQSSLRKDFVASGLDRLNAAIAASGVPALIDYHAAGGWRSRPRQAWGYATFAANMNLTSNRAIRSAFGYNRFSINVIGALNAEPGLRMLVARGSDSTITPADSPSRVRLQKFAAEQTDDRLQFAELSGYGHEAADNIVLHALLARFALTNVARSADVV